MAESKSLSIILVAGLLVFFAAGLALAENTNVLSGEALLKAMRDKADLGPKPAYENRLHKPLPPTQPTISEKPKIPEKPVFSEQPTQPTVSDVSLKPLPQPLRRPIGDPLLAMVPAESLFCVRINHFDYTLSQTDQFLAGVSPVPIELSMLVRMQFAQLLGSPELKGVNMGGSFAVFATTAPSESIGNDLLSILVPVTDYKQFISGNPNIGPPDTKGVSKFSGKVDALVMQAGNYALIKSSESYDKLLRMAKAISEAKITPLTTALDAAEAEKAIREPVWVYGNIELAQKTLGAEISEGLERLKVMTGAMQPTGPGGTSPAAAVMGLDVENLMKQIRFLSLTLNPKPNVLNITYTISAVPGTKMVERFAAEPAAIRKLCDELNAQEPKQMGAEIKQILALLPDADKADFVGTYNLMNLFKMAAAFSPTPMPQIDIPTKSNISFAGKVGKGTLTIDIALPKEHLAEIAAGAMMIQQQMMQTGIGASAGPDLEPFKEQSTWVKCRNPACGHAWEMNLKEYFEFVEKNADPRSILPPPLTCPKCGESSGYRAVKCAKCGLVFEIGSVRADFADRCPKCRYSKTEQDRKKAAEARKKLNR